jgi:hypothetical protein
VCPCVKTTLNNTHQLTDSIHINFCVYESSNENPMYTIDKDVKLLGMLTVPMPDIDGGKHRRININIHFGYTILIFVSLSNLVYFRRQLNFASAFLFVPSSDAVTKSSVYPKCIFIFMRRVRRLILWRTSRYTNHPMNTPCKQ